MLSPLEKQVIERKLADHPDRQALCIEALKVVQRQRGQIPDDCLRELAELLNMAPEALDEVVSYCRTLRRAA